MTNQTQSTNRHVDSLLSASFPEGGQRICGEEALKETPFSSRRNNLQLRQTAQEDTGFSSWEDERAAAGGQEGDSEIWDSLRSAVEDPDEEHAGRRAGERGEFQRRPRDIWQMALDELALSMPAPTYETWVRDTSVMGYEDGEFVIGVPHAYARDWLQNRLRPQIKRILSRLLQRSIEVTFRVRPRAQTIPEQIQTPTLYQGLDEPEMQIPPRPQRPLPPEESSAHSAPPDRHWMDRPAADDRFAEPRLPQAPSPDSYYDQQPAPPRGGNPQWQAPRPLRSEMLGTPLNPHYTFESFIVGSHNRLAHAAALSVADHPGYRFNPLFVYGGVGLGKTHLLHAIGHQMLNRGLRVLYCSSEQFTNELISAIRSQSTEEFRNKYRQVDLLLIDDIQFIGGKESTQEEFFHTFNHLHAASRQVVISSDRPPKDIATLEARLRSRFEGGLQADISLPDLETRVAILQSKALAMGARIDQEVLMLVAERVDSNIRELEGALNRLIVQSPLHQSSLDRKVAEGILDDLMPQRRPREASGVIELVAAHFNLSVAELLGRGRTKEVAFARQIAMYLLREENGLSLPNIGDQLGGRDHSTVRYGVEKVIADLETDEMTRRHVIALREKVYAPPGSL